MKFDDTKPVHCPNCHKGNLDDRHSGNLIRMTKDGRLGICYYEFMEGNWSATPVGCYNCKALFTLPDLAPVNYSVRGWIFDDPEDLYDAAYRTSSGGYYTHNKYRNKYR